MSEPARSVPSSHAVSRRAVIRAAAWTAPVVGLATVAPAAAAASLVIPDPLLPTENPLPIPEPTLPQITTPPGLKTVPPPIPGIPPGPGQPAVVLPDKIPPKIFKPKNGAQPAASETTPEPETSPLPTASATP
jgi:hypothetical protein